MNERRSNIIDNVFTNLDVNNEGRLSVDVIQDRFDGTNHPLVTERYLKHRIIYMHIEICMYTYVFVYVCMYICTHSVIGRCITR
jgi:hypothetical protein